MPLSIRRARDSETHYFAKAMVSIPVHITVMDPYVAGLPREISSELVEYVRALLDSTRSILLIAEDDGELIGCLIGTLGETSFPPAGMGTVGHISVTWVESSHRGVGVAQALVSRAEEWFKDRGVSTVELSYLAANELAATAWSKLGYKPFRVFAYKDIGLEKEGANDA